MPQKSKDMVDMKLTKKEKTSSSVVGEDQYSGPEYPWGLQITLGGSEMKKLGVSAEDYAAGDEVVIECMARIQVISLRDTLGGKATESLELQITRMQITDVIKPKKERK